MGRYCAMRTCKNVDTISPGVKRHRFPNDEDLRKRWEQFVIEGNRNTKFKAHPSNFISLCERHFEPSAYNASGRLQSEAIPTIADKFTPEVALKFGLIPSLDSKLLKNVNKFSDSIIKRVRSPEPVKNTVYKSISRTIQRPAELEDGTMQFMVIDLGEAAGREVSTTDNSMILSSFSPESEKTEAILGKDVDIVNLTSILEGDDQVKRIVIRNSSSASSSKLQSTPSLQSKSESLNLRKIQPRVPKEVLKEFATQTSQLATMRRDLRNVRRKYTRAMTKIGSLTEILKELKDKQRLSLHREPQLNSCLHCGKDLN